MMNYKILFLIIMALTQLINCTSGNNTLFYRAVERADVEIIRGRAGLIRTLYCDIYIEYVDGETLDSLKKNKLFRGAGSGFPSNPCFHFIIVNTWKKPFTLEKVEALYNGEVTSIRGFQFHQG